MSFEEQIMSKDKYTSIFSGKIEAIVFIFYQIFCNARERMFTNCFLRGMFFAECSLVRLYE